MSETPSNVLAIALERVAEYRKTRALISMPYQAFMIALADEIERLQREARNLVPGVMRCAKCEFQLVRTNLYVNSGTVGPGDSKTEPCPNGCGPLWPVTWKQWAEETQKTAERFFEEAKELRGDLEELHDAHDTLERENDRLRTALAGIQSCSTCEACRGAATLALGGTSEAPKRISTVEILREVEDTLIDLGWHKDRGVLKRVTDCLDEVGRTLPPGDGQ